MQKDDSAVHKRLAALLTQVADGTLTARAALDAIEQWTDIRRDDTLLNDGYHALYHFDADQDIRARDVPYAVRQIEGLRRLAAKLDAQ